MVKARTSQGETLLGAGIIISQTPQETLILTARHNLQETAGRDFYAGITVEFRTRPGRPVTAQPVQESISRHDIALLRVPATDAPDVLSAGAAVLAPRTVVDSVIERVVAIGYGGGVAWYQAASPQRARRLSAAELEIETSSYMPGQSGGAVFTEDWALLGMIVEVTARSARALPIHFLSSTGCGVRGMASCSPKARPWPSTTRAGRSPRARSGGRADGRERALGRRPRDARELRHGRHGAGHAARSVRDPGPR